VQKPPRLVLENSKGRQTKEPIDVFLRFLAFCPKIDFTTILLLQYSYKEYKANDIKLAAKETKTKHRISYADFIKICLDFPEKSNFSHKIF